MGSERVALRPRSREGVAAYLDHTFVQYREELLAAGISPEEADANITRNRADVLRDDGVAEGQFILDVLHEGRVVGVLWLGLHNGVGPDWWIYDIELDTAFRGTGLGRPTLAAAQDFVLAHGGTRLGLNVFGGNAVARHLYEAAGYTISSIQMYKDLV